MRPHAMVRLLVAALAALSLATPVGAQVPAGGLSFEGEIELGGRFFIDEPSASRKAKLEEYSDLTPGMLLERLNLRLFRPDESYSLEIGGARWGYEDQEYSLRAGRIGRWEFGFDWDQTPHVFATNARMLATETARGVYVLPARISAAALSAVERAKHDNAPPLDEISVRWDTAKLFFSLTPTPGLELRAEYKRINKEGNRPIGVALSTPGGQFIETLEPIEQTIDELRLKAAYATERWQVQFQYLLSLFQNSVESLTVDNPLQFGDGAFAGTTSTPGSVRLSLPPDNMAHTLSLAGGVSLPMRTRLTGNFSYSLWLQNDDFLPHTRNPSIPAATLSLPATDLDGRVHVTNLYLSAVTRPLSPLTLSAKYRLYDLQDDSEVLTFIGNVENDNVLRPDTVRAGRWDFRKQNVDVDGRWQIFRPLALTLGAGWERWDRSEHREVQESDELFGKAAVDATIFDWLQARLTYRPSVRRLAHYDPRAHKEHSVIEDAVAARQGQSVLLRKFDEGERNRHRIDALLNIMPHDSVTLTPIFSYREDDYIESRLGLQKETAWSAGMDASWAPTERFSISAGYVHEKIDAQQRSRSRPVTGTTTFDFVDFDWVSKNVDVVDTIHAGVRASIIPKMLEWTTGASYSYALGSMDTYNPVDPNSGTAAQIATAKVRPIPSFEDSLLRVETALKYTFLKSWTAALRYTFEQFEKQDWRTDQLTPTTPTASSVWLGADLKDYSAHIIALTVGYRFK